MAAAAQMRGQRSNVRTQASAASPRRCAAAGLPGFPGLVGGAAGCPVVHCWASHLTASCSSLSSRPLQDLVGSIQTDRQNLRVGELEVLFQVGGQPHSKCVSACMCVCVCC